MLSYKKFDIKYCIPSHWRAETIMKDTIALIPKEEYKNTYIFVNPVDQLPDYQKTCHPDINLIPVDSKWNVAVVRQAILDYFPDNTRVMMLDDDAQYFTYIEWFREQWTPFLKTIKDASAIWMYVFNFMDRLNIRLCGIIQSQNNLFYSYSYSNWYIPNWCTFIKTGGWLHYNTSYLLSEDTYIACYNKRKYWFTYWLCNIGVICKTFTNDGGCKTYRDIEKEEKSTYTVLQQFPDLLKVKILNTKKSNWFKNLSITKKETAKKLPIYYWPLK